ncbi:MAG: nicotinamide riboside transporter PnuC [Frankiaceae bacterium]
MSGWLDWADAVAFTVGHQSIKWADLVGNLLGLATVGLALRRSILTWPVQIAGCVLLFSVSWSVDLKGNAMRQVALAVLAAYGWAQWLRGRRERAEVPVRWAGARERAVLVGALAVGTLAFAGVLQWWLGSWNPILDSYIFVGSLGATYAQARGWVEFWFVWIAVDLVGVPLAATHGLVVSGAVYGIYLAMCLAGVRDWARRARPTAMAAAGVGEVARV